MEKLYQIMFDAVENNKDAVLEAERYFWTHPETGFREWQAHAYLKERFEALGYELHEAGDIPGFYTDLDTGKPGPKIAVFGEMDSLINFSHPECDPKTGAVHSCGHNCQIAALLGLAIALKAPGALDGLCGSIRLIAVPAEEGIEFEYRRELRKKGVIRYFSGKLEFLRRGYLDGVALSMMVHVAEKKGIGCLVGTNGSITKKAIFHGRAAHAGGSPHKGLNALYAATTALSAANALRETFQDKDSVRYHPIITKGGDVVNAIPDEVIVESYIRGAGLDAMKEASDKINRAMAACAASMGCTVTIEDEHGYAPRNNDANLREIFHTVSSHFFAEEDMNFNGGWGGGCSDMGDMACVMPTVHPHIGGAKGASHSDSYLISDPNLACVTSAKIQAGVCALLLSDGAQRVEHVVKNAKVPYASKEEFFRALDKITFAGEGVVYHEDGTVTLRFHA